MAKKDEKSYIATVFDGMRAAEGHNSAENTASVRPITPSQNPVCDGFGTPMVYPQPPFSYGLQATSGGFQSYMYDCCTSLIPGTTIGTYVRCTGAEFVVDNWKIGCLYRIETTDHQCAAFLTKKTPEVLEFSYVDDEGNNVVFEIKANDLCCNFQERTAAYPTRMVRVPTNPIIIYPIR